MNKEIRTLMILLCTAALALSSCAKHTITPEEDQPELIEFAPVSETAQAKSTTLSPLSDYHPDFGVWGIAREAINSPYILWDENHLTQVKPSTSDNTSYIPTSNAYWFKGFTYNFIAVAPYTNSGITSTSVDQGSTTMSFEYNIADKYALKKDASKQPKDHYEFDLMAAVAQTGPIEESKPSKQDLTFLHLFAQININVSFANLGTDANGESITGTVSQMRLHNIDSKATYSITNDGNNLDVTCEPIAGATPETVSFNGATGKIHILPQDITGLEFLLDFKIGDVLYTDYKLNLNIKTDENPDGTNPSYYDFNEKYNWKITIGPKAVISFKVTVDDWNSQDVEDGDSDDNNDVEIV